MPTKDQIVRGDLGRVAGRIFRGPYLAMKGLRTVFVAAFDRARLPGFADALRREGEQNMERYESYADSGNEMYRAILGR